MLLKDDSVWAFPIDLAEPVISTSEYVYSFVLKKRSHAISISNWPCITLGHDLQDNVAKHDFWGTSRVINCLKNFPGWENGIVTLKKFNIVRKPITPNGSPGEVIGISPLGSDWSNFPTLTRGMVDVRKKSVFGSLITTTGIVDLTLPKKLKLSKFY